MYCRRNVSSRSSWRTRVTFDRGLWLRQTSVASLDSLVEFISRPIFGDSVMTVSSPVLGDDVLIHEHSCASAKLPHLWAKDQEFATEALSPSRPSGVCQGTRPAHVHIPTWSLDKRGVRFASLVQVMGKMLIASSKVDGKLYFIYVLRYKNSKTKSAYVHWKYVYILYRIYFIL